MRRSKRFASAALLVIVTLTLSACGPDDSVSTAGSSAPAVADNVDNADNAAATQDATQHQAATPASASDAPTPYAASDPITQNMQASLAADNQQVAPVMHYAPGDSASTN